MRKELRLREAVGFRETTETFAAVSSRVLRLAIHATNDLETALAADTQRKPATRVLVLSGTGSCCRGQSLDGATAKICGWGHILGDKSSGYEIGLRALKARVFYFDRDGTGSTLGQPLLCR